MRAIRLAGFLGLLTVSAAATAIGSLSPFPDGYENAYDAYVRALPTDAQKLIWLTRLNEVASPARPLKLGKTDVMYMFGCKQHACDTDQANVFLYPDKKKVTAVVKINGVQTLIGGAGAMEVACVKKLEASGGTATAC